MNIDNLISILDYLVGKYIVEVTDKTYILKFSEAFQQGFESSHNFAKKKKK